MSKEYYFQELPIEIREEIYIDLCGIMTEENVDNLINCNNYRCPITTWQDWAEEIIKDEGKQDEKK